MAGKDSSFGKRQGIARESAPEPQQSPNPTGEGISFKNVLLGNLVFVGVAAALLVIFSMTVALMGLTKQAHAWSEIYGMAITVTATLVAAYYTARRTGRAWLLHGLMSSGLIVAVVLLGLFRWRGFYDLLITLLQIAALLVAAVAGGTLARAQSRVGVHIPWWRVGRCFLAILSGFVISIASIPVAARLGVKASMTLPTLSLILGIITTLALAPPGARKLTASIYFGLIIAAVTIIMIHAQLTHTVRPYHWLMFLELGVVLFLTRKLWRDPAFT